MAREPNGCPTRSLYIGAAGEHYIMAECFRNQMEAFKLPIDKGFDLVVTNAARHFQIADPRASPLGELPVYLQVKSLRIRPEASMPSLRPEDSRFFPIKRADLDLLLRTPNSALACVLFIDENESRHLRGQRAFAWWHSSAQLRELADESFFEPEPGGIGLRLNVMYRGVAEQTQERQNAYVTLTREHARRSSLLLDAGLFDFGSLPTLADAIARR